MVPGVVSPPPPYCAEANCSIDGSISEEPAKMTIVDTAIVFGIFMLVIIFELDYLTFMSFVYVGLSKI
jgi:hypothetical protein